MLAIGMERPRTTSVILKQARTGLERPIGIARVHLLAATHSEIGRRLRAFCHYALQPTPGSCRSRKGSGWRVEQAVDRPLYFGYILSSKFSLWSQAAKAEQPGERSPKPWSRALCGSGWKIHLSLHRKLHVSTHLTDLSLW
jgi:hypothetical protein